MKSFVIIMILAMVLVSSVGAEDINRHSSLYMDVVVKNVVGVVSIDGSPSGDATYNITFVNNVGDEFFFTNVTKPFKVSDRTTLEVEADFAGEIFRVINMYYVVNDTRFTYPNNRPDEWKLHVALIIITLVLLFGGYLLGYNNRPYNKRKGG